MFKTLLVALAVIATALVGAQSSASARVQLLHVSGTWMATDFGVPDCSPIGDSEVRLRCTTTGFKSSYDGSLKGESTVDFASIIDCEAGITYGSGVERFEGSIDGVGAGGLTWDIFFFSRFDCTDFSVSGFVGVGTIQSASGDLAGIRGTLLFDDVSYTGVLRR
jgi:hypothetical protein